MSNEIDDFIGTNGCYLYGKRNASDRKYTNIENHVLSLALHEGIIDSKTFLKCQYKLTSNERIANRGKSKYSWLSGILRCGHCNSTITLHTVYKNANDETIYYLSCTGKKLRQDCDGVKKTLKLHEIEGIVEKQILHLCSSRKVIKKSLEQVGDPGKDLKMQIQVIEEKISNLIDSLEKVGINAAKHVSDRVDALVNEKQQLLAEYQRLSVENGMDDTEVFRIMSIAESWHTLDKDGKRDLVSQMIESITITEDNLTITWKKPFDFTKTA